MFFTKVHYYKTYLPNDWKKKMEERLLNNPARYGRYAALKSLAEVFGRKKNKKSLI